MRAVAVATPVDTFLAARGRVEGRVIGTMRGAVHVEFREMVISLIGARVSRTPNAISVEDASILAAIRSGEVVRAVPGSVCAGALNISWEPGRAACWDPTVRETGSELTRVRLRGEDILWRLGAPCAERSWGGSALAGGLRMLSEALVKIDPGLANTAAARLIGLGSGSTPEGDDLVASVALAVQAFGPAAGWSSDIVRAWLATCVPEDLGRRTTSLSATLLRLASQACAPEEIRNLLQVGGQGWIEDFERLRQLGHSTGRNYLLGVGLAATRMGLEAAKLPGNATPQRTRAVRVGSWPD